jgi:hypothetical protein
MTYFTVIVGWSDHLSANPMAEHLSANPMADTEMFVVMAKNERYAKLEALRQCKENFGDPDPNNNNFTIVSVIAGLPKPIDGACVNCGDDYFKLVQTFPEFSECEWDAETKKFVRGLNHKSPDARFVCGECAIQHELPEELT